MAVEKVREHRGLLTDSEDLPRQDKADLAAAFQFSAIRHLEQRLNRAILLLKARPGCEGLSRLVLVGGVAANAAVRSSLTTLAHSHSWTVTIPPPPLCTDNGVMAAWAGIEKFRAGMSDKVDRDQEVYARFPFANVTRVEAEERGEREVAAR